MTVKQAAFEGQLDGTVFTAGSSGNSDDNGDDQAAVGLYSVAGGNLVYSTEQAHGGLASLKLTNTSNATVLFGYTSSPADAATFRFRIYVYIATMPSVTIRPFVLASSAGSTLARLQLSSTGQLQLIATGTSTGASLLSTGQWYRIEIQGSGLNSAAGAFDCQVYAGPDDTGTPYTTMSLTAQTTAALGSQHRLGVVVAPGSASGVVMYFDDLASEFGSDTPFGPASAVTNVSAADALTQAEGAATLAAALATSDTSAHADAVTGFLQALTAADPAVLSEVASETSADDGVDAQTLGESAAVSVAVVAADSLTLADAAAATAQAVAGDSLTHSDAAGPVAAAVGAVDSWSTVDVSSPPTVAVAGSDALTLADSSALQQSRTGVDASTLADTAAGAASVTGSDAAGLAESALRDDGSGSPVTGDSSTLTEAAGAVTVGVPTTDTATQADAAAVLSVSAPAADAWALVEASAVAVTAAAADALTVVDTADLSAAGGLAGVDGATLGEVSTVAAFAIRPGGRLTLGRRRRRQEVGV